MENAGLIGLVGVLAGLLGAAAGVAAIVWGLGFGEYLGGKKKRPVAPVSRDELKRRLAAVNAAGSPYELKPSGETDLVLEWRIADARWFALFGKERLKKTYRAFILLDEGRASVRYCEEMATVRWVAGSDGLARPRLAYQNQFFRGRILFQKSWEVQYGLREDLSLGKVYEYRFDIGSVRGPLKKVIEESGWEFVPVVRKAHATYRSLAARPV